MRVCGNSKKKKKKKFFFFFFFFFEIGNFFFFKLGKKSHKSHWERGRISAPEDTKKNMLVSQMIEAAPFSQFLYFNIG